MKNTILLISVLLTSFALGMYVHTFTANQSEKIQRQLSQTINNEKNNLKLGAFSVSLNVKDLTTSKIFYESLGFKVFAGGMEKNYLIMKNENALIGLFQGMFKGNILTFNPGWDENAKNIEKFDDVRTIQKSLKKKNIKLTSEADEKTTGPASLMLNDPDGNVILVDQHR
ncbi:MAG: glyoxalase [Bacteroidetes bacterium]|nr:glyoxalase [Bacteroidota bacterium]